MKIHSFIQGVDADKLFVPLSHVRVRLFRSKELTGNPEIEAILPLEPSGEFDLRKVKLLWGLDTCTV